ncbi:hypothetical protein D3C80_1225390 [compost metagenome]
MLRRNTRDLRDDVLDLRHFDALHALLFRLQALVGTRFVDDVDRLVRHVPVIDIARSQLGGCTQRLITVFDVVMRLETPLQATQDADGVFHRRLGDIDLLEAPRQGPVLLEDAAKLLERGRPNAADISRRQQWLEQVGGVHHATGSRTGTDDGVDLIDEQDRLGTLFQLMQQRLEALLEVAAVLGTRQQRAQVQGIDDAVGQKVRHLVIDDTLGQPLGDGCLADTGFADQQRVVLAPPGEDLRNALDLAFTPDQWVDTALACQFVQIACVGVQWIA